MKPEVLEHCFDPFFTTRPIGEGAGLGLSIVYSTIKNLKGEINMQSQPRQGTTISITLPIEDK